MKRTRVGVFSALFAAVFLSCSHVPDKPVGGTYDEKTMESLVEPPEDIALHHRILLAYADSRAGREVRPGRVMAWSPDVSLGSGLLEQYIEDGAAKNLDGRMIAMLRMLISYEIPCPFALDINSWEYRRFKITADEIDALRGVKDIDDVDSFSKKEKLALAYARAISATPVRIEQDMLDELLRTFSEKEIVAIAALSAKVNYWARLLEGLRVKPAGYTDDPALHLQDYNTFSEAWRQKQQQEIPALQAEEAPTEEQALPDDAQ